MNKKEFLSEFSNEVTIALNNLYNGIKLSSFTTDEFNDKNRIFANFRDFNDVFVDLEYYRKKKEDKTVKLTLEITTSNNVIIQKLIERFEDNFTKEGEE